MSSEAPATLGPLLCVFLELGNSQTFLTSDDLENVGKAVMFIESRYPEKVELLQPRGDVFF